MMAAVDLREAALAFACEALRGTHLAGMRAYVAFRRFQGASQWPPDPAKLREFAVFLGLNGYAASTIQQYVSSVQVVAQLHGVEVGPARDAGRQAIVAAFARRPGQGLQPMACLSHAVLCEIVRSAPREAAVFVAMLLVQLFTLARAESVAVQPRYGWRKVLLLSDLDVSHGLARVRLHDWKYGEGQVSWETLPVARGSPLCPVRALAAYLAGRPSTERHVPLFVFADGSPVSYDSYRNWLRLAAVAAGAGAAPVGTNSIRRAGVALLEELHVTDAVMDAAGRWVSCPRTYRRFAAARRAVRAGMASALADGRHWDCD